MTDPTSRYAPTCSSKATRRGVQGKCGAIWAAAAMLAIWLGAGAAGAFAQTDTTASPAQAAASAAVASSARESAAPVAASVAGVPAVPKYSAGQIKTIFNYLDRNHDGVITREEAAGFKGVARNFDRADTNHDGALSFEEFEFAMMRAK